MAGARGLGRWEVVNILGILIAFWVLEGATVTTESQNLSSSVVPEASGESPSSEGTTAFNTQTDAPSSAGTEFVSVAATATTSPTNTTRLDAANVTEALNDTSADTSTAGERTETDNTVSAATPSAAMQLFSGTTPPITGSAAVEGTNTTAPRVSVTTPPITTAHTDTGSAAVEGTNTTTPRVSVTTPPITTAHTDTGSVTAGAPNTTAPSATAGATTTTTPLVSVTAPPITTAPADTGSATAGATTPSVATEPSITITHADTGSATVGAPTPSVATEPASEDPVNTSHYAAGSPAYSTQEPNVDESVSTAQTATSVGYNTGCLTETVVVNNASIGTHLVPTGPTCVPVPEFYGDRVVFPGNSAVVSVVLNGVVGAGNVSGVNGGSGHIIKESCDRHAGEYRRCFKVGVKHVQENMTIGICSGAYCGEYAPPFLVGEKYESVLDVGSAVVCAGVNNTPFKHYVYSADNSRLEGRCEAKTDLYTHQHFIEIHNDTTILDVVFITFGSWALLFLLLWSWMVCCRKRRRVVSPGRFSIKQ